MAWCSSKLNNAAQAVQHALMRPLFFPEKSETWELRERREVNKMLAAILLMGTCQ